MTLAACGGGGDEPPPAATPAGGAAAAPAPATPAPGAPKSGDALQVYLKVEDLVPADEVKTIRHKFKERDFALDPSGDENRDPFQSFVINQPGMSSGGTSEAPVPVAQKCDHMIASKYALRDLKLVAIMSRGLRRYALFQDTADHGNLAAKGDCLGKEKAQVGEIGDRTVTLKLVPEQVPNQAARAAEDKSIFLYPPTQDEADAAAETASPSAPERPDEPMLRSVSPGGGT
ncbi:MAG: pilus assembly protein PilP [Deltaproteobacteria bacterium]|nr:pilus assembly protein PilP [Deltaproteobacteria bacterium]